MVGQKIRLLLALLLPAYVHAQTKTPSLIPLPVKAEYTTDSVFIQEDVQITATPALQQEVTLLRQYIREAAGTGQSLPSQAGRSSIQLLTDTSVVKTKEGYQLLIGKNVMRITAHDGAGVLHAIQTLRQLWQRTAGGTLVLPGATITDYPRFAYRGMHLDVSRHFFPVSFIKQFIDQLALYKINNFHWHLTDDQGWRLEIKKYPGLQSVSAWRAQTMIGHKKELPHRFDGKRYGGYYTQEEVKEVIAYAAARHIRIIPEIEMPGHALAALAAYPSLGCTGGPYQTAPFWGVFDDVFCAGKDSTFLFLQDVLDEVMALFPSPYIHIGGDECPKVRWAQCPACRQRMQTEHLPDKDALQSYFIRRISDYVNSKGRKIIGWDEILEGGLAPGATVMSWRGVEGAQAAARQQQQVIMTPEDEFYFDHYQSLYPEERVAAGGYTPLDEVYGYEPLHSMADTALLPYIAGVQGEIWSEYLPDEAHARYMIFPRLQAVAERAWSPITTKDYPDFLRRLHLPADALPYEVRYRLDSVSPRCLYVSLYTAHPVGVVRYTTDGSVPGLKSPVAERLIKITRSGPLKARLFVEGKPAGRVFTQDFLIHKATGATVTLKQAPNTKYTGPAGKLVNGIAGTHRFNDAQWLGFSARDLDAVIDLGSLQSIHEVGAHVLNYHWQRMWAPVSLSFEASTDGVHYTPLATAHDFPVNGINKIWLPVTPVKARYIRVHGINKGIIPAGEYGAGGKSMLLADEMMVR